MLLFIAALHPAMNKMKTTTELVQAEEKAREAEEEMDTQNMGEDIGAREPEKKTDHLLLQADHRQINQD